MSRDLTFAYGGKVGQKVARIDIEVPSETEGERPAVAGSVLLAFLPNGALRVFCDDGEGRTEAAVLSEHPWRTGPRSEFSAEELLEGMETLLRTHWPVATGPHGFFSPGLHGEELYAAPDLRTFVGNWLRERLARVR